MRKFNSIVKQLKISVQKNETQLMQQQLSKIQRNWMPANSWKIYSKDDVVHKKRNPMMVCDGGQQSTAWGRSTNHTLYLVISTAFSPTQTNTGSNDLKIKICHTIQMLKNSQTVKTPDRYIEHQHFIRARAVRWPKKSRSECTGRIFLFYMILDCRRTLWVSN